MMDYWTRGVVRGSWFGCRGRNSEFRVLNSELGDDEVATMLRWTRRSWEAAQDSRLKTQD